MGMIDGLKTRAFSSFVGVVASLLLLAACGDAEPGASTDQPATGLPVDGLGGVGGGGMDGEADRDLDLGSAAGTGGSTGLGSDSTSGSGGTPGATDTAGHDGGVPPADDAGVIDPPGREDLGVGNGRDVVTIGDSWMSLGRNGIQYSLVRASGQRYRTHGVAGTRLLNGQIPGQYASAKRDDPNIKTVVMTGGGNDILLTGLSSDCARGGTRCQEQLAAIGRALRDLWAQMAADGVQDVVHVLYSSDAGRGVDDDVAGSDGLVELCASVPAPLRCHLLPTDDLVRGDLRSDGIHPSNAAYDRIGQAVYEMMIERGMRR